MFTTLLKRHKSRESGFTMIELLVAVVIIAILAAIAVPVYLNLKTEAAKSALKSDVNATVKAASIALTQGTDITTITANDGAAYVSGGKNAGEKIYIAPIDSSATTTGAAFVQDRDNSSDGYVIKNATFSGAADGVARATTAATADNQYFYVYGVLDKTQGAPVNYTYSFNSVQGTYTPSGTDGSTTVVNSAPTMPVLIAGTLPQATIGKSYTGSVSATGNPAPTFVATGLPTGLVMDSVTGAISGTSNAAANTYTVSVKATNSIGTATQSYSLSLVDSAKVKINTSSVTSAYTGTAYTGAAIDVTNTATTGSNVFNITGLPTGFSYSGTTGAISGQSATASNNTLTVKVTNGTATDTASVTFNVVVGVAPVFTSPANGFSFAPTLGQQFTSTAITATGTPTPTITTSALPAGLSFNTATNKIEGTPTVAGSANFPVTITAKNDVNPTGVTRTIYVNVQGVSVYTSSFGNQSTGWSGGARNAAAGTYDGSGSPVTYAASGLITGAKYTFTTTIYGMRQFTITQGGTVTDTLLVTNTPSYQTYAVTFVATSTSPTITMGSGSRQLVQSANLTQVG